MRISVLLRAPLLIAACVIVGFVLLGLRFSPFAHAQTQQYTALTGYAWSDTIGWISMNCDNADSCASNDYSISIGSNGTLSGYAWSDNIGWVSANHADVAYCETNYGGDDPQIQNGQVTGWLRVISGNTSESGGWDGCISLSGSDYGVTVADDGTFSGFAWGDINVGWVDFSLVSEEASNSSTCAESQFSENGSCVASCSAGYTQEGSGCVFTACPEGYTQGTDQNGNLECTFSSCPQGYSEDADQNGNPECVQAGCSAGPVCQDGSLYQEDASCNLTLSQSCTYGCSGDACNAPPAPTADIVAIPSLVQSQESTQISWSALGVSSCTVSGSNGDGTGWNCTGGSCAATSTETSSAITGETTYTLSCTGLDNSTLTENAIVNIAPNFCETGAPNCL